MKTRAGAVFTAFALVLVLTGCGGDDDDLSRADDPATTTTAESSTTAPEQRTVPGVPAGALEVELVSGVEVPAGPHVWQLELTNVADDAVTVTFRTGQRGDVVLQREDETVHRWSDGRFFTQEVTEQTLQPGEVLPIELEDDLSGVEPGFYDATVTADVVDAPEPDVVSVRVVAP
ncbi:MAG: BsuPI-related putative proteinase inhibitor [Acidimicrobiales bacterium]|nr:BsuPI-related putative proteinase inhibitor [Acidimicrobiales bacterium]